MSNKSQDARIGPGFPPDAHREIAGESTADPVPSPDAVLWEIGGVIAVCLGLAVAATLLVAVLPGP